MSFFDDIMADDAAAFVDGSLMPGAERVTLEPEGERERVIWAQVFREKPETANDATFVRTTIFVSRADYPVVTKGGDRVTLADQDGTEVTRMVVGILRNDAAGYELELQ